MGEAIGIEIGGELARSPFPRVSCFMPFDNTLFKSRKRHTSAFQSCKKRKTARGRI